ncbi:hypothetical protein D8Y23_15260 [Microbacterium enclense]|uniref:Uncharacterized protein n=1 Tax=Microbacterium enclense TaxID=993073 RepID=A0A443J5P0_9MICO|nr:hypothetical protein [Microbacterium enclense]RWR15812.1 hypothetical protein D8Y23_15260 [Microbacterium enclense]
MSEDLTTSTHAKPRRKRTAVIVAIAAGVLVVAAAVAVPLLVSAAHSGPDFEAAVEKDCGLNLGVDAQLLDDGKALTLNGAGEESTGLSLESMACVLTALDVPDATITRMDSTRAMDGRQRDQLDGHAVKWTYHPDDGLDVLLSK